MTGTGAGQSRESRHNGWIFPPRFMLFLAVLPIAIATAAPLVTRWGQAVLCGFDVAVLVFITSLWALTREHTPAQMRAHARANDTRRLGVLLITSLVMVVVVTAVTVELPNARQEKGTAHAFALGLVLLSLVIAWAFSNLIFALHYAHLYYRDDGQGGLNFPQAGKPIPDSDADQFCPDYLDFAYFSLTIGMAFATADVAMPGRKFRHVAIIHAIAAFFYNLVVLAFTINVTAGS